MLLTRGRSSSSRRHLARWTAGGVLVGCGAAAGAIATRRIDRRRAVGRVRGAVHGAATTLRGGPDLNDATLAHKVESEVFRPADSPKGRVDVNACDGIVELRGEVEPELVAELGTAAAKVHGVRGVRNLLHAPGTAAPHAEDRPITH